MKQETVKALADGSNILTASTGVGSSALGLLELWNFVNTNAAGLGVGLTFLFGVVAIGFNIYNSSKLAKADRNEEILTSHVNKLDGHEDRLDSHIKETKEQFDNVNSGIDKILSKLPDKDS